jgi:hypothetical protein
MEVVPNLQPNSTGLAQVNLKKLLNLVSRQQFEIYFIALNGQTWEYLLFLVCLVKHLLLDARLEKGARICKRLWSPGMDPPAYAVWRTGTTKKVVVPARQDGNRFLGSLAGPQIRALSWNFETFYVD